MVSFDEFTDRLALAILWCAVGVGIGCCGIKIGLAVKTAKEYEAISKKSPVYRDINEDGVLDKISPKLIETKHGCEMKQEILYGIYNDGKIEYVPEGVFNYLSKHQK